MKLKEKAKGLKPKVRLRFYSFKNLVVKRRRLILVGMSFIAVGGMFLSQGYMAYQNYVVGNRELALELDMVNNRLSNANDKILEQKEQNDELEEKFNGTVGELEEVKGKLDSAESKLNETKVERDELKKEWATRQSNQRKQEQQAQQSSSQSSASGNGNISSGTGQWMTFNASAYSTRANGDPYGGAYGNLTATGTYNQQGRTIAVDPSVIPLGSKVEVQFPSGWEHMNGTYVAENTGSAIKGNIIDVYMDNYSRCLEFGRRTVKVRVVN